MDHYRRHYSCTAAHRETQGKKKKKKENAKPEPFVEFEKRRLDACRKFLVKKKKKRKKKSFI